MNRRSGVQEIPKRKKVKIVDNIRQGRRKGYGSVVYVFKEGSSRRFPTDVEALLVFLRGALDEDRYGNPIYVDVMTRWPVVKPNENGALWKLGGTIERPTLSPSLHWRGYWHGWLKNGVLEFIGT